MVDAQASKAQVPEGRRLLALLNPPQLPEFTAVLVSTYPVRANESMSSVVFCVWRGSKSSERVLSERFFRISRVFWGRLGTVQ